MNEPPYVNDLDAVTEQVAAWIDMYIPGGYQCLRCGDTRWQIRAVRLVKTDDYYRFHPRPAPLVAVDIGCLVCYRIETYDISQLRLIS